MNKFLKSILVLITLISFSSCGIGLIVRSSAKKNISPEKGTVPPSFISKNATLLILVWDTDAGFNNFSKKAFNKFYSGNNEFVTFKEFMSNEKYKNLEKYPYIFNQGPGDKKIYEGNGYEFTYRGGRPFHIFDRKENKFYNSKSNSGFYSRIIQAYAMKLDDFIK
jgi:hypothetical protein